jgi:pimeloyl-ACP methyl ester carboxylesterase
MFKNEWPQNMAAHWRMHFPPESWNRDWRPSLATLQVPTLVIHGTEDLIPVAAAQDWAATMPLARLLTIPGVGHFPHLEDPDTYFPAVDTFLAGTWPEGAKVVADAGTSGNALNK